MNTLLLSLLTVIRIAAFNSSEQAKACADVICTGTHDEVTIQQTLDKYDGESTLTCTFLLADGTYHIDGFHHYGDATHRTAIKFPQIASMRFEGENDIIPRAGMNVEFKVRPQAYDDLGIDEQVCVMLFSDKIGRNKNNAKLRNFQIMLPDTQHKVICINLYRTGGAIVENLRLNAAGAGAGVIPVEGSVGIRGQNVNTNGIGQYWKDIYSIGFYEAFQIGGEHTVCVGLLGYKSYYGYTFGNYETVEWGVWEHPITLINCSEELCASLPLFNRCGEMRDPNNPGLQCIDMISHTMEFRETENPTLQPVLPAREVVPGTWCGNITFAANHNPLSKGNAVNVQFWERGSGHRFKTRNSAHALAGTTQERLTYIPTYIQTYYDTDLNKLLVFNGEDWVDANGNKVD